MGIIDYRRILLEREDPLPNAPKPERPTNWTAGARLAPLASPDLYGAVLHRNKLELNRGFNRRHNLRPERRVLMMAMAMLETNTLSEGERDASKDGARNGAANVSIFNLNEDLIRHISLWTDCRALNSVTQLSDVVSIIDEAINRWGVSTMLDFVRGGRDAFNDHVSWGAAAYRRAIATSVMQISQSSELMTDARRPMLNVDHV